jgi:transporter family-2 protein
MSTITYAVWALAAGALIPLMAILNGGLARALGGSIQATLMLFATGFVACLVMAIVTSARLPALPILARIPAQQFAGGLIVGFYVLSITFLAPRFGVGNAILFAVTAQLLTAAAIDHYAIAGAALRPVTTMRASGLLVVIAGVVLTQAGDRIAAALRQMLA